MDPRNHPIQQTSVQPSFQLKPASWTAVDNAKAEYLDKFSDKPNEFIHCHIPLCIGYTEVLSNNKLMALVEDFESKGYPYTIYLSPKNPEELAKWKNNNAAFLEMVDEGSVVDLSKWRRTSPLWIEASEKYKEYYESSAKKDQLENSLQGCIKSYGDRHKDVSEENIKQHIVEEVADVLYFLKPRLDDHSNTLEVNVLVYSNKITEVMYNAIQNIEKMGYDKSKSMFVQMKPKFEPKPKQELVSEQAQQQSQSPKEMDEIDVIYALLQKGVAPEVSGRAGAGYGLVMRQQNQQQMNQKPLPRTRTPSPSSHSPKEESLPIVTVTQPKKNESSIAHLVNKQRQSSGMYTTVPLRDETVTNTDSLQPHALKVRNG